MDDEKTFPLREANSDVAHSTAQFDSNNHNVLKGKAAARTPLSYGVDGIGSSSYRSSNSLAAIIGAVGTLRASHCGYLFLYHTLIIIVLFQTMW